MLTKSLSSVGLMLYIIILALFAFSCSNYVTKKDLNQQLIELRAKSVTFEQADSISKSNLPKSVNIPPNVSDAKINYFEVDLNFATNRNKLNNGRFGLERSKLSFGQCKVTIPKIHEPGEIEKPLFTISVFADPSKHMLLTNTVVESKDTFYSQLSKRINQSSGRKAFIFIHGYKTSFEDAALRTAQIYYDLKFKGAPVFFSWPSQDSYADYFQDESNIEWAEADLKQFLTDFAKNTNVESIYLIAHSMGSRAISKVLSDVSNSVPLFNKKVKELILAAPDIDAEVFKTSIAPKLMTSCQRITLYTSDADLALGVSKKFHGYPRLGNSRDGIVTFPGIETIDASGVETDFIGHSYFSSTTTLIQDISDLIDNNHGASQRTWLKRVNTFATPYWKID